LDEETRYDAGVLKKSALRAFLISGFLLALPGGLLPLWGYHVHPEFGTAGNYFLALGGGMGVAMWIARMLVRRFRPDRILAAGCFLAAVAMAMLSVAAPPSTVWYEGLCVLVTGAAAGVINGAIFESVGDAWEDNPAGVTLSGGIYFGTGSIAAALLMAQSVMAIGYATATRVLAIGAAIPAAAAIAYLRTRIEATKARAEDEASVRDRHTVLATLFGFLLFFQFANEWSIAGWLAIYLIDRLGMSPAAAVTMLAFYWIALTVGRMVTALLMQFIPHGRLLGISAFCALFGGTAMTFSDARGGVIAGILLMGAGFSAIGPLASERIAPRLSGYHPDYFAGLFMFAMSGGTLAAFGLGHLAGPLGLRVIPIAAMVGSCAVILLVSVIRLGRKVSGN
jgi:fucose permease